MGTEIERKFLPASSAWRGLGKNTEFRQGYLATEPGRTVRVRTMGKRAVITIKGPADAKTLARDEFEYDIPHSDADAMLNRLCVRPLIEKSRHEIEFEGTTFEVDEFHGLNEGLVVIEVELTHADQPFARPPWLGEEVTADRRYSNSALVTTPYCTWAQKR